MARWMLYQCINNSVMAGLRVVHLRVWLFALILCSQSAWSASLLPQALRFTGTAYDLESDKLIYIETHVVQRDSNQHYVSSQVMYNDAGGALIATKQIDYANNPLAPNVFFEDLISNQQIHVSVQGNEISLSITDQATSKVYRIEIPDDEIVVIDAGFDRLVEQYWSTLVGGKDVNFNFFVLTSGRFVSFKMFVSDIKKGRIEIQVTPTNWLYKLAINPIVLNYDSSTRGLLRFEGLTNIPAYDGKQPLDVNYVSRIEYQYEH